MRIPLLLAVLMALPAQAADWLYLTYPGDTLSQIGQTYLKNMRDWPRVQAANGVLIPKHLPANTRIKIPVELLKVTPAPATVTAVTGNVRYKSGSGPFQPLAAGVLLNGGESVLSGPRSSAAYRLADGTLLTQQASSKLAFGRLAAYGKTGMVSTELSLDSGRLEAHAAKQLAPAGGFKVITPVAVAGLRGTDFRLNVAEDGKTLRNEVLQGTVAVAAQGREVRVDGGYGTLAEAGKPPDPPRALLPAPSAEGLNPLIERLPLSFTWPPLAGARAYRAQLAPGGQLRRPSPRCCSMTSPPSRASPGTTICPTATMSCAFAPSTRLAWKAATAITPLNWMRARCRRPCSPPCWASACTRTRWRSPGPPPPRRTAMWCRSRRRRNSPMA